MRPLILRPCRPILGLLWEPTVLCSISLISSLLRVCIWPSNFTSFASEMGFSCCRIRSTVSAFRGFWCVAPAPLWNQQRHQEGDYGHVQLRVFFLRTSGLHVPNKAFLSGPCQHWRSLIGEVFPRACLLNLDRIDSTEFMNFSSCRLFFIELHIFFTKLLMLA